jgi:hypothetical protein
MTSFISRRHNPKFQHNNRDSEEHPFKNRHQSFRDSPKTFTGWRQDGKNTDNLKKTLLSYYRRISKMMTRDEFPSDYDRIQFVSSVLDETIQNLKADSENEQERAEGEVDFLYSLNDPLTSRIIQTMVEVGPQNKVCELMSHFSTRYPHVATGRFSGFILEAILKNSTAIIDAQNEEEMEGPQMKDLLRSMCTELQGGFQGLLFQKQSSFIIRSLIDALAHANQFDLVDKIIDELLHQDQYSGVDNSVDAWLRDPLGSGALVAMLQAIPSTATAHSKLIRFIFRSNASSAAIDVKQERTRSQIIRLVKDRVTSHIIDALLDKISPGLFDDLYSSVFRGQLVDWCANPVSHYAVIKILNNATHKEQFELMYGELESYLPTIYNGNIARDVLIAIADGCVKYETKQTEFIRDLLKASDDKKPTKKEEEEDEKKQTVDKRSVLVTRLLFDKYNTFDRYGCKMLCSLLRFKTKSVQVLYEAFLTAVDGDNFFKMCVDKSGSQVAESLLMNKNTQNDDSFRNIKYRLIKKLTGKFAQLAVNPYGSHVVEKCILVSERKRKANIAKELISAENDVRISKVGNIVWEKCRLGKYKTDAREWLEEADINEKRRAMFKDILGEEEEEGKEKTEDAKQEEEKPKKKKTKKEDSTKASGKRKLHVIEEDIFANVGQDKKRQRTTKEEKPRKIEDDGEDHVNLSVIQKAVKKLSNK